MGGYLAGGISGGINSFRGIFGGNSGNGQKQMVSGESETPDLSQYGSGGFTYKKNKKK